MTRVIVAHAADMIDFIPLVFLGAAAWVIKMVLNEAKQRTPSTPTLPMTPIERQMRAALRGQRGRRATPGTGRSNNGHDPRPGARKRHIAVERARRAAP